jgi:hypothetical protein
VQSRAPGEPARTSRDRASGLSSRCTSELAAIRLHRTADDDVAVVGDRRAREN